MTFAIVDIETTGGSPVYHRVVEIGIVLIQDGEILDKYHTLINPGFPIPFQVSLIHGITDSMVEDAPFFHEVASEIQDYLAGNVFVAHSVNFDYGFLKSEFNRAGMAFEHKRVCTVRLSKKLLPGLHSHSLATLCQYYKIENQKAHRALEDAMATAFIWKELNLLPDFQSVLTGFLKSKSGEMNLPPNLDKASFDLLPPKIGVYIFHDQHGKVVYVGKALDIKDRVGQHFSGNTHTKAKTTFLNTIFDVSFELAGNELMALLLENELIKKYYPRFNSNNKAFNLNYGIFKYEDQNGFQRLCIGESGKWSQPLFVFRKRIDATETLLKLTIANGLCLFLNGLRQDSKTPCSYLGPSGQKCFHCEDGSSPDLYNEQVEKVVGSEFQGNSFLVRSRGRTESETGIVWVDHGKLKGYGYLPNDLQFFTIEDIKPYLKAYYDTQDAQAILKSYLPKTRKSGVLENQIEVLEMTTEEQFV